MRSKVRQETHSVDQTKLGEVVAIPAPVEGAVEVLVRIGSPVDWVKVVVKLSKVMNPAISLHDKSPHSSAIMCLKAIELPNGKNAALNRCIILESV